MTNEEKAAAYDKWIAKASNVLPNPYSGGNCCEGSVDCCIAQAMRTGKRDLIHLARQDIDLAAMRASLTTVCEFCEEDGSPFALSVAKTLKRHLSATKPGEAFKVVVEALRIGLAYDFKKDKSKFSEALRVLGTKP